MNVYLIELKSYRKSLILWCIGMVAMIAAGMAKYAGLSTTSQSMNALLAQMPKSLQAIMGVGSFDLSTALGYFGLLYLYLLLIATIHATMIGATILSKEERDKTVEFLFVKPISRSRIIALKLLAAFTNIVFLNIVTWISSISLVGKYSHGASINHPIGMTMLAMFILQVLFMSIGSVIAALCKRPNLASSISTGILLITFILSMAIDLSHQLTVLKYVTPFKYFEAKHVMYGGGLDSVFVLLSALLITLFLVSTFLFYKKRDLTL